MTSAGGVLHGEDDPDIADLIAISLKKDDSRFDNETAENVAEGLDTDRFDWAVSDNDMPGQNSIQFLRAVRETVLGRELTDIGIFPTGKVGSFEDRLERVLSGETFTGIKLERRAKNGDSLSFLISASPVHNEEGTVDGVLATTEVLSTGDGCEPR